MDYNNYNNFNNKLNESKGNFDKNEEDIKMNDSKEYNNEINNNKFEQGETDVINSLKNLEENKK